MMKSLLRGAVDMTWSQVITAEFAEPICFTTDAHRDVVVTFLREKED